MIELLVFASLVFAMQQAEQTFTPCQKTAGVPINLHVRHSPAPMIECPALSLQAGRPVDAVLLTQAGACAYVNGNNALLVLPVGPAKIAGLAVGMTPDAVVEHEMLHALQGMRHPTLLPFGERVCAE